MKKKITTITGKINNSIELLGFIKNIYDTMIATKELYRKAIDNRNSEMYKHFQQSFKPNEITPEKAHEIGKNGQCKILLKMVLKYVYVHT